MKWDTRWLQRNRLSNYAADRKNTRPQSNLFVKIFLKEKEY